MCEHGSYYFRSIEPVGAYTGIHAPTLRLEISVVIHDGDQIDALNPNVQQSRRSRLDELPRVIRMMLLNPHVRLLVLRLSGALRRDATLLLMKCF